MFLKLITNIPLYLFSDLCGAFGIKYGNELVKGIESHPSIQNLLTEGRRSKVNKTKSLAIWATKEIRKLKNVS